MILNVVHLWIEDRNVVTDHQVWFYFSISGSEHAVKCHANNVSRDRKVVKSAISQNLRSGCQRFTLPDCLFSQQRVLCLCFQFWKHASSHLEPNAPVVLNHVGLGEVGMAGRYRREKGFTRAVLLGLINDRSLFSPAVASSEQPAGFWSWIANANLLRCWLHNMRKRLTTPLGIFRSDEFLKI